MGSLDTIRGSTVSGTERGVSEVLGVLLAFGLVTSVLALVQVSAVPVWVATAEDHHSADLRGQVADLDEAVLRAATSGVDGRQSLELSPRYDARLGFVMPPAGGGRIWTTDEADVTVSNARAADGAGRYWDGTDREFATRGIAVSPSYNELADEPTHYVETAGTFTRHATGTETVGHHALVSGTRITIVTVEGDLDRTATGTEVVSVTPVSTGSETVQIAAADDGKPIRITVPSELGIDAADGVGPAWTAWVDSEPYVLTVDRAGDGRVVVELDPDQTYQIRLARVHVGTGWPAGSDADDPEYLRVEDGDGATVVSGQTHSVVVSVRDRYNNPVVGATVEASEATDPDDDEFGAVVAEGTGGTSTATTDSEGLATFVYTAPASIDSPTDVTFEVVAVDEDGNDLTDVVPVDLRTRNGVMESGLGPLGLLLVGLGLRRARPDTRASTALLGLLFAFGLVVALVVLVQMSAVPVWNSAAEFDHSEGTTADLVAFDDAVQRTAGTGSAAHAAIDAAPTYPDRPFLLNPAPIAGSAWTTGPETVVVENAAALGPDAVYWDGERAEFETRSLRFEPNYASLSNSPTLVHEGTAYYTAHDDVTHTGGQQVFVDGTRISLVLLDGDVDLASTDLASLELTPVSTGGSLSVYSEPDAPLSVTIPSELSVVEWEDLLADQMADHHVASVAAAPGGVKVTFEAGVTYQVSIAKVSLDGERTAEAPRYVAALSGNDTVVPEEEKQRVVLAVRDQYGNPVPGVHVDDVGVTLGDVDWRNGGVTDERGRVSFDYDAPDVDGTRTVTFGVTVLDRFFPDAAAKAAFVPGRVELTVYDDDSAPVTENPADVGDDEDDPDVTVDDTTVTANTPVDATIRIIATEDSALRGDEVEYTVINSRVVVTAADGTRTIKTPWPDGDDGDAPGAVLAENINDPRYPERAPYVPWVYDVALEEGTQVGLELTAYQTGDRQRVGSTLVDDDEAYHETVATSYRNMRINITTEDADEGNLIILRNGESVPNAGVASDHQWSIREILGSRMTDDGTLRLASNEVVVLFELSEHVEPGTPPATDGSNPDFNDAVAILSFALPGSVCGVDDPGFPYLDVDGDGAYGPGDVEVRDVATLRAGTYTTTVGTLVVPASFGDIEAHTVDISAPGLVLDVDVTATEGGVRLDAGTGSLCAGGNVHSEKDGKGVDITGDGDVTVHGTVTANGAVTVDGDDVTVDGAHLESTKDGKDVEVTADGELSAVGTTMVAEAEIRLTGGSIVADGAAIESTKDSADVRLVAETGDLSVVDATLTAEADVVFEAAGNVDMDGVTVVSTKDSANIDVFATGDVDLDGASLTNVGSIAVEADGDVSLVDATLFSTKQQDFVITAGGSVAGEDASLRTDGHIAVTADGDVDLDAASLVTDKRGKSVSVAAGDDVYLRAATLSAGGNSPGPNSHVTVTVGAGGTVYVDGLTVSDSDDSLAVAPASATVVG